MEKGGEIKGVKRRVRLRGGVVVVVVGAYWQFQVRDEEECWMAIYRAETEKEAATVETTSTVKAKFSGRSSDRAECANV